MHALLEGCTHNASTQTRNSKVIGITRYTDHIQI